MKSVIKRNTFYIFIKVMLISSPNTYHFIYILLFNIIILFNSSDIFQKVNLPFTYFCV